MNGARMQGIAAALLESGFLNREMGMNQCLGLLPLLNDNKLISARVSVSTRQLLVASDLNYGRFI